MSEQTTVRSYYYYISTLVFIILFIASFFSLKVLWSLVVIFPLFALGIYDILQKKSNILRNYPVWGHWRYTLLRMRPEIQAYFIETEWSGRPFTHAQRFLVYQRANKAKDAVPLGTQLDVHKPGYEWVTPSLDPKVVDFKTASRVVIGNARCTQPYNASRLNVSGMSFGAISPEAVRALNWGAKMGHFYQDTGEGGISPYHLAENGDLVWEIGTAYFGCRTKDGKFDRAQFKEKSRYPQVKMIEIKLSQGAKPGLGALLPGAKVTAEIAKARGIPAGVDCVSPATHSTFSTPIGLLEFVQELRELSGGKPTGFKLCVGIMIEFMCICKAMIETQIYPDFIVIDGSEGGTGAAPLEFSNHVGMPLNEGLVFVNNCLIGTGLRKHIRLIASGKVISGFDILTKIALGADIINSARGMMFALGCVQSRRCHLNTCPTGVTTQDPKRRYALHVKEKSVRVKNFQEASLKEFLTLLGASGFENPEDLHPSKTRPSIVFRRTGKGKVRRYDQIYYVLGDGDILNNTAPILYQRFWEHALSDRFVPRWQPMSDEEKKGWELSKGQ